MHNLRANTTAHIEVGTEAYDVTARELPPEAYDVTARELPPEERDDMYPKVVAVAPRFGDYQANTSRVIPLFELQRA